MLSEWTEDVISVQVSMLHSSLFNSDFQYNLKQRKKKANTHVHSHIFETWPHIQHNLVLRFEDRK